jgi:hypothetical protein
MEASSNFDRLRDAGMFEKTPLPDRFMDVIDSLDPGEVDALIAVKQRFDEAGLKPEESEFREYIHWF